MLFFRDYSVNSETCGTVVRFAAFDNNKIDPEGVKGEEETEKRGADASAACVAPPPLRAEKREARKTTDAATKKMETSMLGFSMHHPQWQTKQLPKEHSVEAGEEKREQQQYKWAERNDFNDVLEKLHAFFERDQEPPSQLRFSDEMA